MGQRGVAPAPAAIKILRGDHHRARIERAPQPQDPPVKPKDLTPEAARVWDRIIEATTLTSHIGQAHADTFRAYCEITARLFAHVDPMSKEWRDLANSHRQLARELCLTPATSTNLRPSAAPKDKLARFLA
jgi:phage terminase small subunit